MTSARSRTLLSRSHLSSMTNGYYYPIYYQGVVSMLEKGSLILIRYTKNKLALIIIPGCVPVIERS